MNALCAAAIGPLTDFDERASSWLHAWNSGLAGRAAIVLSAMGSERAFIPFAAVAAIVVLWERQFAGAAALAIVTAVTRICISAFKHTVRRVRPAVSGLSSSSFPSGHAMAGSAVYGTAAFVLMHSDLSLLPVIAVWSSLLAAAVGLARVIRGFHWLTDVVASVATSLVLLILICIGVSCL
jgi:undecaprenyl-diphosphatase